MQYEVSAPMNMNHNMAAAQYSHQNLYVPNGASRIKSENGSDRGVSPHTSEQSSRYSSQTPQNGPLAFQQIATQLTDGMANGMRYPSPVQMQQQNAMPMLQHSYHPNGHPADQQYQQAQMVQQSVQQQDPSQIDGRQSTGNSLPKAFACSTCQKGFARRSDLARHERIHSGVRPHVCDHPGCGKQFIQRSALTVHSRVHTGEKPHMCERCGKPFSDSSSLARHRRIHSGKRPYKCPYADCQKTFTRRTTLTRHQNHHTGTIEESEAATAAALASRAALGAQRRGSDQENDFSTDGKSPLPPNGDRTGSVPPHMNGASQLNRQSSNEFYMSAMNNSMNAVPAHMRGEMGAGSRSGSPVQYGMQINNAGQRGPLTSNPSPGYNPPPQILEPPANNGQQQQQINNGNASPHLASTMGWQSPNGIPATASSNDYSYPDPNNTYAVNPAAQMYYQSQQQQQPNARPHSTGPLDYQNQLRGHELWTQQQS